MISRRPDRLGTSKYRDRSKRPGRRRAGSRSSARLVAPITRMLAIGVADFRRARPGGSRALTFSTNQWRIRIPPVGASNDWSWMSSSLTTPAMPSRPVPPIPAREAPMASISSMNPMAPPSARAALRRALK